MTALLAIGLFSAPAHAEPATLSGTITGEDTGAALNACVNVYDSAFNYTGSACTDESGTWSLEVEAGGEYKVWTDAYDGVHAPEWTHDSATFDEALTITAPASVDVVLGLGGTLAGHLTRADGTPSEWTSVNISRADDPDHRTVASPNTYDQGDWSVLLTPGDYIAEFQAWPTSQWALGQESVDTATRLTVAAGQTTRADDQFLAAAKVRGTIVSDQTGEPVEGACVMVFAPTTDPDNMPVAGEGCTGADGTYEVAIAQPGTYAARFHDENGQFVEEYSGNTRVVGDAATFEVTREEPSVVNASLATGSVVTGRAVDAKTGTPIAGACPLAHAGHDGGRLSGLINECSGSDGRWTIRALPAGEYAVMIYPTGEPRVYGTTWAFKATSQATATLIPVPAATTKSVRDVQMMPGGSITGVITGPTGEPVAEAWVSIDSGYSGRAGGPTGPIYAQTDADGRYTIHGVPAGEHTVFVEPRQWSGLAPRWSGNADRREDAALMTIKAGKATAYNAVLSPGAQITGSVVTAEGQPTTDYWVGLIFTTSGDYIGDFDVYNGNTFNSSFLPPGDFTLQLRRYSEDGEELTFWYDSATSEADATVVSLERGESRDIVIHLP